MSITIRPIRESDADSFYEALCVVVAEQKYLAFAAPPPLESTRSFVADNVKNGHVQLVADDGGKVVGWCDITPAGRDSMRHVGILGIALLPDYRGAGLGERLMLAALDAADSKGLNRVELSVHSTNTRAHALYQKLGFVDEGIRRRLILLGGVYLDSIIMARLK